MSSARSRASRRGRVLWAWGLLLQAQLSPPSRNGADAAAVGCLVTTTIAADFVPAGMLTGQFVLVGITTTYPGGVYGFGPGRSLVVFAHRSKNLTMYSTGVRCGAEK